MAAAYVYSLRLYAEDERLKRRRGSWRKKEREGWASVCCEEAFWCGI